MALLIIPNSVLREIICTLDGMSHKLELSMSITRCILGTRILYVEFTGTQVQRTDERNRLAYVVEAKKRPEQPWEKRINENGKS